MHWEQILMLALNRLVQDLVLMNTEEPLIYMTANSSLGCGNHEMVV